MHRGTRIILALAIMTTAIWFTSVPALGYDVAKNAPNCDSKGRAAEKLTGDRSNKQYFTRITTKGANPAVFTYTGPYVTIKVKRDFVVKANGAVFTQREVTTLRNFYVECYKRLDLPYTYYWAPQECLDLGLGYTNEQAETWYFENLGGRRNSWSSVGNVNIYNGPVALFTVPQGSIVRDLAQGGAILTPGYQVWSESFTLTCYAHQFLAGNAPPIS